MGSWHPESIPASSESSFKLQGLDLLYSYSGGFSNHFDTLRPIIPHICDNLTRLYIQSPGDSGELILHTGVGDNPIPERFVDVIKVLLELHSLELITIIIRRRFNFDDDQLCKVAYSWPRARSLVLGFPIAFGDPRPYAPTLGCVAKACAQLIHIELPTIGMPDLATSSLHIDAPRNHPLATIQTSFQDESWKDQGKIRERRELIKKRLEESFPNLRYYRCFERLLISSKIRFLVEADWSVLQQLFHTSVQFRFVTPLLLI